jgi:hypothetical protein
MTQRFEITCLLQRELVNSPAIFGMPLSGSAAEPAVEMQSSHAMFKEVAGVANLRPAWFFDVRQQGEGLADVGTHLVDLVSWILFPEQAIDYHREIQVTQASHWPTLLTREEFLRVTGEREFPAYLQQHLNQGRLEYFANNRVQYALRGIQCRLTVQWHFDSIAQPETSLAIFRGSQARIEVRQDEPGQAHPELYVIPNQTQDQPAILAALREKVASLQNRYAGLAVEDRPSRLRVVIPDRYRIGHEAHFALLTRQFLEYARQPQSIPRWEGPNLLAKYYVTTQGIALAREPKR